MKTMRPIWQVLVVDPELQNNSEFSDPDRGQRNSHAKHADIICLGR